MEDELDTYCRLCAETTPIRQLISAEDDVAVSSKVLTKMEWINIDVSSNILPTTICFSCFDLLEKTWAFLHNARTAQAKLASIFVKKTADDQAASDSHETKYSVDIPLVKPVEKNWEDFHSTKQEVKVEDSDQLYNITVVDTSAILQIEVKSEQLSDDENDNNSIGSDDYLSDSNAPVTDKKKKSKRNKSDYTDLGLSDLQVSWEQYMCRCAQCDAQCKNIECLQLHSLQIHGCCSVFKCLDCNKVISSYHAFINHVRTHNKSLRRCCQFCYKRFNSSSYLKKHISNSHRKSYLTTCSNCGSNFETPELLQDHILIYSRGQKKHRKQEPLDDLKCEHCNKEFKSRSNLQQHKLVHMERNREFACHICGKMFFTKGTLSTHMNTHEDAKPHKCEFCSMAFRARGNLLSHISLHSGSKPFVCEQCGKSFRVKRHLKSHSIVHTDLMPYVCEYCNKQFRFKTRLNLHLRQHTGAKPYTCIFCQRDFTNGSNFKKHMKRRHNIDTSKKKFTVGKEELDNQAIQVMQATVQATVQAMQATQA